MDQIIQLFNKNNVRYLLIGGQAVRLLGLPRYSMDWDFFIPSKDHENFATINELMKDYFDVPLVKIGPKGENFVQTYQTPCGVIQFHLAPIGLPPFDEAEKRMKILRNENGLAIMCISTEDMLSCKRKISRPKDAQDIGFLEQLIKANKNG